MTAQTSFARSVATFALMGAMLVAFTAQQTACSSKTCTSSEESACTSTFTTCTNNAAASGSKDDCLKCVEAYCSCYDSCGNSCDKGQLSAACQ